MGDKRKWLIDCELLYLLTFITFLTAYYLRATDLFAIYIVLGVFMLIVTWLYGQEIQVFVHDEIMLRIKDNPKYKNLYNKLYIIYSIRLDGIDLHFKPNKKGTPVRCCPHILKIDKSELL